MLQKPDRSLGAQEKNGKGHGPHDRLDGNRTPRHITTGIRTVLGAKNIS